MKDALTRLKTALMMVFLIRLLRTRQHQMLVISGMQRMLQQLLQYSHTGQVHGLIHFQNSIADKTDKIIAIKPIKELGSYKERLATAWCITYKAYENGKAEGIFKYFIDTMLDGGDIQIAWQYGAKGTHWDDKAETVTVYDSKGGVNESKTKTYEEGVFHFLTTPEDNTKLMSKNHIDKSLAIATFGDNTDQVTRVLINYHRELCNVQC